MLHRMPVMSRKPAPSCKFFKTVSRKCLLHNFSIAIKYNHDDGKRVFNFSTVRKNADDKWSLSC